MPEDCRKPEAGSANIRETRARRTKLRPDVRVFARAKKARPYLTHDGERLMPFDVSPCHLSLSRIIVAILHSSYE